MSCLRSPSPSSSFSLSPCRLPLLLRHISSSSSSSFGEAAGECLAIGCCCPCGLLNLLVLTIYKVPAGLCRAALRRKRREKGLLPSKTSIRCRCAFEGYGCGYAYNCEYSSSGKKETPEVEAIVKLEKEMWEIFYGTGFWRSPSRREHLPPPPPSASLAA